MSDHIYLHFTPRSLRQRREQYEYIYDCLKREARDPNNPLADRLVLRQVLQTHERVPSIGNLKFTLTPQEWKSVSRALRQWGSTQTRQYQLAVRHKSLDHRPHHERMAARTKRLGLHTV